MSILTRRQFLASTSAVAAGTAMSGRLRAAEAPAVPPVKIKTGVDTMTLGKSGIKTSVLGIARGLEAAGSKPTWAPTPLCGWFGRAMIAGIRYIDTADMYGYKDKTKGPRPTRW